MTKRPSIEKLLRDAPIAREGMFDFMTTALGIEYLFDMPETVPADQILVHNHVRPQSPLGRNGFRAWLHGPDPDFDHHEVCDCGWAPQLPEHYRVIR